MSPGPIQLDQATALTLMLGPNGSVGIQASYRIVKDHGGDIELASAPGRGTTFTIRVPVDAAAPGRDPKTPPEAD